MNVSASALRTSFADTATATSATANQSTASSTSLSKDFDKDTFLKLLVAQLKYQDPTNPTDMTQFMSQTAQFTMVEKVQDLAATNETLLASNQTQAAMSLVGRQVTWADDQGNLSSGRVDAVSLAGGVTTLRVGDAEVTIEQITEVRPDAPAETASPA